MAQDDEHLKKGYKRGKWAGKMVTLKKNRILTPFKRGQKIGHEYSYRAALMPGALDIAKGMGFAETFPDAQDETIQPPNSWLHRRAGELVGKSQRSNPAFEAESHRAGRMPPPVRLHAMLGSETHAARTNHRPNDTRF